VCLQLLKDDVEFFIEVIKYIYTSIR